MNRVRAADDFKAIRLRVEELRRERERHSGAMSAGERAAQEQIQEPDAVAHVPSHIVKRFLANARRSSAR